MENPLVAILIVGAVVLALSFLRARPAPTVVYVPVEVEAPRRGIGCLPALLILLVLYMLIRLMAGG